jgi:transcription elongation factor GreA
MQRYGITRSGYEKLKKDLAHLKKVERPKIIKEIERARAFGDISENAEYEAAKHSQGLLEARIKDLESKVAHARVIEDHEIGTDTVLLGAVVRLKDLKRGRELTYTIVSDAEADFKSGKISVASPVGKGLLGARVGHTVEIDVPAGKLKYEVLDISR